MSYFEYIHMVFFSQLFTVTCNIIAGIQQESSWTT